MVGSVHFKSGDRERGFLATAGDAFCFPLMERRLMRTGANNALQCTEDLDLKSFVAARCARRQLEVEREEASRSAEMEERIAQLKREKG